MNPVVLRAVLTHVRHPKMRRAWRNRSNVTQWHWVWYVYSILRQSGPDSGIDAWHLAACLYVACGWYAARSGSATFDGANVTMRGWLLIGLMVDDFLECPPDRALTRRAWEKQRKQEAAERRVNK